MRTRAGSYRFPVSPARHAGIAAIPRAVVSWPQLSIARTDCDPIDCIFRPVVLWSLGPAFVEPWARKPWSEAQPR